MRNTSKVCRRHPRENSTNSAISGARHKGLRGKRSRAKKAQQPPQISFTEVCKQFSGWVSQHPAVCQFLRSKAAATEPQPQPPQSQEQQQQQQNGPSPVATTAD